MNDEDRRTKVAEIRASLDNLVAKMKTSGAHYDHLQRTNLLKRLRRLETPHKNWAVKGRPVEMSQEQKDEIKEVKRWLDMGPSKAVLRGVDQIRVRLKNDRYNDFQLEWIHKYLTMGRKAFAESLVLIDGNNRWARISAQRIWNSIMPNIAPLKEFDDPPPESYYLKWNNLGKTDKEGNPYHVPVNPDGSVLKGFNKSELSQTDEAKLARERMAAPAKAALEAKREAKAKRKRLEKESEERAKVSEREKAERDEHFEKQRLKRLGGSKD